MICWSISGVLVLPSSPNQGSSRRCNCRRPVQKWFDLYDEASRYSGARSRFRGIVEAELHDRDKQIHKLTEIAAASLYQDSNASSWP